MSKKQCTYLNFKNTLLLKNANHHLTMQGYHKPSTLKKHNKAKHNKQGMPVFENQCFPPSIASARGVTYTLVVVACASGLSCWCLAAVGFAVVTGVATWGIRIACVSAMSRVTWVVGSTTMGGGVG